MKGRCDMKNQSGVDLPAYAKINLYLDVTAREENGYHKIESVMQRVSLCDRVTVSVSKGGQRSIYIRCNLPYVPRDARNIAYRAAALFMDVTGVSAAVRITLGKRIPVAGGMAGGSTDAAAVLRALNGLFGYPLSRARLTELAGTLGSDVPFCLRGKTAVCTGYGEIMTGVRSKTPLCLLIVTGGENVSTPWAFEMLDNRYQNFNGRETDPARLLRLTAALENGDAVTAAQNMYNVFEDAIFPHRPRAARAKALLLENGALGALMSGSGPTVFGVFPNADVRFRAGAALLEEGFTVREAYSL